MKKTLEPTTLWEEDKPVIWPIGSGHIAARSWKHVYRPLQVLRSLAIVLGEEWIHVSVSRFDRIPNWKELSAVKDEFIGLDVEAYQVLAKQHDHINVHPFCLHLWTPIDGKRRVANLKDIEMEKAL